MSNTYYETHAEIYRVATTYYKDTGCCAVIAIAITCGVGYGKAYHAMRRAGRIHGQGSSLFQINAALTELGAEHRFIPMYEGRQMKSMPKLLPEGAYMVFIKGHVAAIRDGVNVDWTAGRAHRVRQVWKII